MWRRRWHPTPVLLPGKSHGQRSLGPWGHEELDTTERLPFHFSLSCIGEGNANPLQCSCLENPRDWGAWWAAVYAVTQSRTRLKWLSSSNANWSEIYVENVFICQLSLRKNTAGNISRTWYTLSLSPRGEVKQWKNLVQAQVATHSSILAWRIPGMEEPGGLPSMGSHRVGHDWSDLAAAAAG